MGKTDDFWSHPGLIAECPIANVTIPAWASELGTNPDFGYASGAKKRAAEAAGVLWAVKEKAKPDTG
jgi:hypothetical protein